MNRKEAADRIVKRAEGSLPPADSERFRAPSKAIC